MSDTITLRFPADVSMPAIGGIVEIEDTPFGKGEVIVKGKMWKELEDGFEATYTKEELEFCLALADIFSATKEELAEAIVAVSVQTESDVVAEAERRFGAKKRIQGEGF